MLQSQEKILADAAAGKFKSVKVTKGAFPGLTSGLKGMLSGIKKLMPKGKWFDFVTSVCIWLGLDIAASGLTENSSVDDVVNYLSKELKAKNELTLSPEAISKMMALHAASNENVGIINVIESILHSNMGYSVADLFKSYALELIENRRGRSNLNNDETLFLGVTETQIDKSLDFQEAQIDTAKILVREFGSIERAEQVWYALHSASELTFKIAKRHKRNRI